MVERDPSGKALVFSQFTSMLDLCAHRLEQVGVAWPIYSSYADLCDAPDAGSIHCILPYGHISSSQPVLIHYDNCFATISELTLVTICSGEGHQSCTP